MATIGGYNVVTDGLVLSLDAGNRNSYVSGSSTWFDVSGNRNSGSLVNGPGFDSGNGGSLVFDGVDDYINLGGGLNFTNNFSACIMIKLNSIGGGNALGFYGSGGSFSGWGLGFSQNLLDNLKFNFWQGSQWLTFQSVAVDGAWKYAVATVSSLSYIDFYVNGSFVSGTQGPIIQSYTGNKTVGSRSDGAGSMNGNVAAVQIYNRALSATEVLQNYNATKGRFGL